MPEYLDELAQEFTAKLAQLYEDDDSLIRIGCIFDQPESSQFVPSGGLGRFLQAYIQAFSKPVFYDKQVFTARHAVFPIVLDITPLCARKRAMEAIIQEYRDAELQLQQVESEHMGLNINEEEL